MPKQQISFVAICLLAALAGVCEASQPRFFEHKECPSDAGFLYQNDFDFGTVILDRAGIYCLGEDIKFFPNSEEVLRAQGVEPSMATIGRVQEGQFADPPTYGPTHYSYRQYSIGFFAAIALAGDDIVLDLNGFTLSMEPGFALLQRWYSNIEFGNQPFTEFETVPSLFGGLIIPNGITIRNGTSGLSAHHCLHGNGSEHVVVHNFVCENYEVAGFGLNGFKHLEIRDVVVRRSRTEIPVYGWWSSGRFMLPYLEYLIKIRSNVCLRVQGVRKSVSDIYNELFNAQANVYEDLVTKNRKFISSKMHPYEYGLFHNGGHNLDGNTYGIVLNKLGMAIFALGTTEEADASDHWASDIQMENVQIEAVEARVVDTVAIQDINESGDPDATLNNQKDAVGSQFQILNQSGAYDAGYSSGGGYSSGYDDYSPGGEGYNKDGYVTITSGDFTQAMYKGNVVANAQAFVSKAIKAGEFEGSNLWTDLNTISSDTLNWIEATPGTYDSYLSNFMKTNSFICNLDLMFHVNKGTIGLRLDGVQHSKFNNVSIKWITNIAPVGSFVCDYDATEFSHPLSKLPGYQGSKSRGILVAGSQYIDFSDIEVESIDAYSGSAYGIDVQTDAHDISFRRIHVKNVHGGANEDIETYYPYHGKNPNEYPFAAGINVGPDASNINLRNVHITDIQSLEDNTMSVRFEKAAQREYTYKGFRHP